MAIQKENSYQKVNNNLKSFVIVNSQLHIKSSNSSSDVNKSIVHISESKKKFIDPGLMISSIQLNVSPCHPSCLTCKDQDKNSCLSCSQNATLDQGTCTCNKDYYFQDGQCVASCNNKNYYHYKDQKESTEKKVCTFINQCTQWQNEKCQACQSPMLPQQDICVSNCSSGFIKVKNKKSNLDECLLSDRFKQVSTVISAFHSNSFSGIEVESISGLNYSGFLQQFAGFDSYVSKCNQYQLFGGFFINQINSKITYTFSAANSNFVKVYFKYIFIDISAKGNAQITVKLNDQSLTIQVSQSKDQIDICGFSDPEFQDNFTLYSALKPSNQLNITNEGNSYLGIRELSIYTFNCLQDNCQNCTVSNKQTICQQCIPGYYQQKGECIQCNPMCLTCSDSLSCNNCLPVQGLTLNESKQCVCQDYFYFDSTNIICKQCLSATCLTCKENSDQCLSCQKPLALLGTECVSSCGNGKAVNQSTNQCALCINNCLNCDNNLSSCNQCQNGFYFLNNKCISACPDGYYSDQKNAKCIPCFQSECINCIQSYDICTKCNNNSYVDINTYQCVSQCSNTQYDDQGYCKNCSELYTYCISCNLKQQCTQCSNNLILSVNSQQCLQSCPQGTVQKGQQCIQCSNNCSQCDINLICQVCSSGFYLYQEECYQSCPSGYYPDLYNQCQPCSSVFNNCQTCSATECLSCDTSSNHQYLDINKTQCLQQCDIGQFFDSQMQCQLCQNSCATCDSSNTSFCKSCDPNNSIGDIFLTEDGKCVSQCPSEFYADANNICLRCNQKFANCVACNAQICLQCEANYCLNIDAHLQSSTCDGPTTVCTSNTCTNINNCLICNNGQCQVCSQNYFLIDDKCDQCAYPGTPSKYFTNYQKQTCDLCSTKFGTDCLECDQNSCTKCQPTNQYIYKNKCENQCGDGYYANSEYNCQPCLNNNCLTCDPNLPKNCLSCPTFGKILLQNNDCVIQCAEGFFQNQNICQLCPANCSNCKSSTQCLKCQDNFLIDVTQSQCIENKCPSGQYKGINTFGSNACFECSQLFFNCTECTQNSCQQCEMPLYLYNNTCNDSCPDNYYPDKNNNCQQCPISKKCKTCNASNCLSCFQNSQYPYLDENGICVSQCKSNQYLKQLTINSFVCTSCSSDFGTSCQQCNSQSCLKCESPQFISELDNNSCVTDCPPGQYGSEETNLCQNCENTRCSKCKFDKNNPSQCTQCMKEYPYLYQGECLSECQEGYFPDLDNNCQSCSSKYDPNCNQCDSEVCHSCSPSSDLFLYNNTCVESCPDFYYPSYQDIKECKVCLDSNCKQCNFLDPSKCLSCSGSYLFNETCVATCPFGTFVNQQENKCAYCFSQFSSCQECTEKSCISCINNLFILEDIQQCVSSCPFNYIDSSLIVNSPQSNLNSNLSNKKTCQKCDNQNCNTCDPRDTKKCLSCPQTTDNSPNQYLYNQDCIQNCDFYVNFATNECFDSCPNYLLQLEQPKSCQECPQFIQSRECVKECTSNTYIDQIHQKLCVVCQDQYDTNCILCNSQQCSKCSQGFYLYKNKCYSQCPENTFIDNENYNCLDKCTYPLVIINSNVCSKACPLGQFKEPINMQDEIICGICDEKCIECTDKSSFCTVCSQGSGWDCLDKEDFHKFIRNQHYEQLNNESEIKIFDELITENKIFQRIIAITCYLSIAICLAFILGNHSFIGVFCIYYIQIFQLIGNYVLIEAQEFKIVNEVLTKYLLAFNTFNLIPQPFEREIYSNLVTFFNYKTLIIDIHNISKYFYINNLYQLSFLLIAVFTTIILSLGKNLKLFGMYFKNNIIPKIFLVSSNMIILSSLNNIINCTYLSILDRIMIYGGIIFYLGVFCHIIYTVYEYRIEITLIQNNLQKFFLVESLEAHFSRRIFWILFEFRKIICCVFVVLYHKQTISIWLSLAISLVFILFLTLYQPFSSKLESAFLVFLEIIYLSSQLILVFMSQIDRIEKLIMIFAVFLLSSNTIIIFLVGRKMYLYLQQKRNEYKNQQLTNFELIKLNEVSIMKSIDNSFNLKKEMAVYYKQKVNEKI